MDYLQVKDLIQTINDSHLTEFELTQNGTTIKMSKNAAQAADSAPKVTKASATVQASVATYEQPVTIMPEEIKVVKEGNIVASPIVGTFYESATPSKPALVQIGDTVAKGDVLCIVEAMKVMNEITSKYDGKVTEILVNNEDMVEFNQPLFRIV